MSALGHKRTFCDAGAMSALPPKADIGWPPCSRCAVTLAMVMLPTWRNWRWAGWSTSQPRKSFQLFKLG